MPLARGDLGPPLSQWIRPMGRKEMQMRFVSWIAMAALLLTFSSCVSYRVPAMSAGTSVNLTRADVAVLAPTKGTDWALGIFPVWLFAPAGPRAEGYAIGKATQMAYETSGADFVLQPKTKTAYYNFILFDYASAEAVGKAARIKEVD